MDSRSQKNPYRTDSWVVEVRLPFLIKLKSSHLISKFMKSKDVKILFVLQFVGQPRFSKRIAMLQQQGFHVEAVAFDRETHRGRLPSCEVTSLGTIEHGKFLNRVPILLKAIPRLRKKIVKSDVVYCMGPDMSLLALFASLGKKRMRIAEVADIHRLQCRSSIVGKIVRMIDRLQIDTNHLLVVTAPDFLNIYYRQWVGAKVDGLVVENKLEREAGLSSQPGISKKAPLSADSQARITIGYFGLLRCSWSFGVLIDLMRKNPVTHELLLAGRPLNIADFDSMVADLPNVHYIGEYKSPYDLPRLYGHVDIVWACYEPIKPEHWNHRWARPNRFYEACQYKKPLITREGCNDSVVVRKNNIGFSLSSSEIEDASSRVATITTAHISDWKKNMYSLSDDVYLYTREADDISDAISTYLGI